MRRHQAAALAPVLKDGLRRALDEIDKIPVDDEAMARVAQMATDPEIVAMLTDRPRHSAGVLRVLLEPRGGGGAVADRRSGGGGG